MFGRTSLANLTNLFSNGGDRRYVTHPSLTPDYSEGNENANPHAPLNDVNQAYSCENENVGFGNCQNENVQMSFVSEQQCPTLVPEIRSFQPRLIEFDHREEVISQTNFNQTQTTIDGDETIATQVSSDVSHGLKMRTPKPCGLCSAVFPNHPMARAHRRKVHDFHRPFVCEICQMGFNHQSNLIQHHKRVHQGETKSDVCKLCNKNYRNRSSLKTHLRYHFKENEELESYWNEQYGLADRSANRSTDSVTKSHPFVIPVFGKRATITTRLPKSTLKLPAIEKCFTRFIATYAKQHLSRPSRDIDALTSGDRRIVFNAHDCSLCDEKDMTLTDLHRHLTVYHQEASRDREHFCWSCCSVVDNAHEHSKEHDDMRSILGMEETDTAFPVVYLAPEMQQLTSEIHAAVAAHNDLVSKFL